MQAELDNVLIRHHLEDDESLVSPALHLGGQYSTRIVGYKLAVTFSNVWELNWGMETDGLGCSAPGQLNAVGRQRSRSATISETRVSFFLGLIRSARRKLISQIGQNPEPDRQRARYPKLWTAKRGHSLLLPLPDRLCSLRSAPERGKFETAVISPPPAHLHQPEGAKTKAE
jgi:hypothetical protein